MKRIRLIAAVPAALLANLSFLGSVGATVVSEPADLPDSIPGPAQEIVLDLGTNFVSGNSSHSGGADPVVDFDDFILTVQPGHVLTGMRFYWTAHVDSAVESLQTTFTLQGQIPASQTVTLFSDNPMDIDPNPVINMFNVPIAAGSYLLNQLSLAIVGSTTEAAADFDYTWKFTVAPVPLPPAAWLFISGLVAMVGLSRRRRAVA